MKILIYYIRNRQKRRKICELILDNINLEQIKDSQVETEELNNLDSDKFLNYINEIGSKNDEAERKIDDLTSHLKKELELKGRNWLKAMKKQ